MNFQGNFDLCRFCNDSSDAKENSEFVDIGENVEQLFFELTQVKVSNIKIKKIR
jgi:hypothetical protein